VLFRSRVFVVMHVRADGSQTLAQAHALTEEIQRVVRRIAPTADVTVHAEPIAQMPTAR
jgi:divalent metal cation (Fe/Co/Zn/Cd) transporter